MKRNTRSTLLSCLLILGMLFTLLPSSALATSTWDGTSSDTAWSGAGTATDPYIIATAAQLRGLAVSVNSGTTYSGYFFALGDDIDLASYEWTPIGGACITASSGTGDGALYPTGSYHFDGVFDGANHSISGISITTGTSSYGGYGLFGWVNGGILANMSLAGSLSITATIKLAGGLVGYTSGSIYNVRSSMTVYASGSPQVGGIAGEVRNITTTPVYVQYCSVSGDVTGNTRSGGIVGQTACSTKGMVVVDQCCHTGLYYSMANTKTYCGGIVGYNAGYIHNCYKWGSLQFVSGTTGKIYSGGMAGLLGNSTGYGCPGSELVNCYSIATFTYPVSGYTRYLFGSIDSSNTAPVTNNFWLETNSSVSQTAGTGSNAWGLWTNTSAATAAQFAGTETIFSEGKYMLDYLGSAYTYSSLYAYPVFAWQERAGFKVINLDSTPTTTDDESTLISLTSFDAAPGNRNVTLTWKTESEIDNAGFNIYRAEADGTYAKINDALIAAEGSATSGASYEFVDTDVQNRATYSYKLEDIDIEGVSTFHGPVSATPRLIYGLTGK